MALIVAAREHHLHDHATVVSPGKAYQRGLPAEAARISFMSEPFPRASLWSADTESHSFRPLAGTTRADVLVVGAGMTGLLTAARLADSGLDVLVVDAGPIGGRNTVMSTGNLYAPVSRLADLISRWGGDPARRGVAGGGAVAAAGAAVHRNTGSSLPSALWLPTRGHAVRRAGANPRGHRAVRA